MIQKTKKFTLVLIKKWFDLIQEGKKKEEYRDISEHYVRMFFNWRDSRRTLANVVKDLQENGNESEMWLYYKKFDYDFIEFANGYQSDRPSFMIEFGRMSIGEGRPVWGAKPGRKYFILKLGSIWAR